MRARTRKEATMNIFQGKSVSLVGYGKSNKEVLAYLLKNKAYPIVRNQRECILPDGVKGIFTKDYLNASEDIVFRSPGIRPDKIKTDGQILCEASYSLENISAYKIGVTGSDGKTTVSTLIHTMLLSGGHNSHLGGNIGTPLISQLDKIKNEDYVVSELSSFQLIDTAPKIDTAVITNISENHLDWHTSFLEYVFAKRNILKKAKRAVINLDCPYNEFFTHENASYFSLNDLSRVMSRSSSYTYISNGYVCHNGTRLFDAGEIRLRGDFNIANILCAIATVYPYVDKEAIRHVATEFGGVNHRMQSVMVLNGVTFIDSSIDSTPTRTKRTLSAFDKEKAIVILGGYDKKLSYDALYEPTKGTKCVIVLGANKEKILKNVTGAKRVINVNTLNEAVTLAYKEAQGGDYVILSPASASFDMFENYEQRAEKFKEILRGLENGEYKKNT